MASMRTVGSYIMLPMRGSARLVVPAVWIVVTACGASPQRPPDGQAGAGPGLDGGDAAAEAPPPTPAASNGVPIPPRDPRDSCAGLDLQLAVCAGPTATCPLLSCQCAGGTMDLPLGCAGSCVTSVDCDAWCALGPGVALLAAIRCQRAGLCLTDQECRGGTRCFHPPGETIGSCSKGELGDDCQTDADCAAPGGCVVDESGQRSCWSGGPGQGCNRNNQCAAGKCLLQDGKFRGVCTQGYNSQFCWADTDCQPGLKCMHGPVDAVCSDGSNESLCDTDADCRPPLSCVDYQFSITGRRCSSGGQP
jgi:hypothetical protein